MVTRPSRTRATGPPSPATEGRHPIPGDPYDLEGPDDATAFVRALTRPAPVPFVPEVSLHVAQEPYGVWEAMEAASGLTGTPPPFWAFTWPGGAALARAVLDGAVPVRGRRVLDLGCGSGLVAVAAALAGAATVTAVDLDPLALAATRLNAALNGVRVTALRADLATLAADGDGTDDDTHDDTDDAGVRPPPLPGDPDVVLAGDLFFERDLAAAVLAVLRRAARGGAAVHAGDPGRAHLPPGVFEVVLHHDVPTSPALEDAPVRRTAVLHLPAGR